MIQIRTELQDLQCFKSLSALSQLDSDPNSARNLETVMLQLIICAAKSIRNPDLNRAHDSKSRSLPTIIRLSIFCLVNYSHK